MPTKMEKQAKRLRAFAKRRAKRPEPKVAATKTLKISGKAEAKIIRDNQDLLQNIEFLFAEELRNNTLFDDQGVKEVLRCAILGEDSDDETTERLLKSLAEIREMRSLGGNELWTDALRVVNQSLHRHSDCRRGSQDYLMFVSKFAV